MAIVFAVLIERFWPQVQEVRKLDAFTRYLRAMRLFLGTSSTFDGAFGAMLVLLPAAIVIGWLQWVLAKGLLALFGLVFAVVALVASIGPRDMLALIKKYVDSTRRGDEIGAQESAERLLGAPPPQDSNARHQAVVRALFRGVNDWFPSVVFWFAWFGPVGAVVFRLLVLMKDLAAREHPGSGFAHGSQRLYEVAIWVPVRVTVIAYAFIGKFDEAWRAWRAAAQGNRTTANSQGILLDAGLAAAGVAQQDKVISIDDLQGCVALLRRTVIVWLVLFAVATLFGILR